MRRDARYWRTPFARWVSRYTVIRLTRELPRLGVPVTRQAVYQWISGRRSPRAQAAAAIERLSGGAVRMQDVYRHINIVGGTNRNEAA